MRRVLRFLLVVIVAAATITLLGRAISDFDLPPEEDPHDLIRGLGIWAAATLVAVLDLLVSRRRRRKPSQ
jgi:hypothetical protein